MTTFNQSGMLAVIAFVFAIIYSGAMSFRVINQLVLLGAAVVALLRLCGLLGNDTNKETHHESSSSFDFDDQADALLQQLLPTDRCKKMVQDITEDIKKVLPHADIVGLANGEVSQSTANGVAVPEIDIVVKVQPSILVSMLQSQNPKLNLSDKVDDRRLQKSAVRMCTDLLVSSGGFTFRRSAFAGRNPKVTLMSLRSLESSGRIPIDLSVNAAIPLCNSVLIAACARIDPRAQMLILLVKRWAKDRAISNAAKGHLMPYAWTLLCIYFLQAGVKGGSLLPPFKHLKLEACHDTAEIAGMDDCMRDWVGPAPGSRLAEKRLGQLFKEFIHFYLREVDWRQEVACIRTGQRAASHRSTNETPTGASMGPSIEDPSMACENVSESLSATGLKRLREELARAQACFESNAPLSEILTKYVPPQERPQADLDSSGEEDA